MPELFRTWPCPDPENCVWDKEEWYKGIVQHSASGDSRPIVQTTAEVAQMMIGRLNLPIGFTDVRDGRYILR